ncbi:MAG: hypothetical protein LBL26_13735 [Peptococcaceae bacterium]|jgi:hypothetical protein|nr:hypothetical protein [Peptococcaceae bacterium]
MSIQRLISIQQIDLASSVVLLEEIYNNPFKYKRERIMEFLTNAKIFVGVERFNYTEWRQEYFKDAYKDSEGTQLENFLDSAVQHFPKNSFGLDD